MNRASIKSSLFRINRKCHRDLGFFTVGLTIVYSVSGLYLNHTHSLNPNYVVEKTILNSTHFDFSTNENGVVDLLKGKYEIARPFLSLHWPSPDELRIFFKDVVVTVDYKKKEILKEEISPRFIIKSLNSLHVNDPRGVWTFVADFYALALCYLAISGIFMVKGGYGLFGRGGLFMFLGLLIPFITLIF